MPKFAANLSFMFSEEESLLDRFAAAREAGFSAVEYMFPYEEEADDIRARLDDNDLEQVLFNLPAGNFAAGERGLANDPARVEEFRDGVGRALEIADRLSCPMLNCLIGLQLPGVPIEQQWATVETNLAYAAEQAQAAGVRQVVEPLNPFDAPGFLLVSPDQGFDLVERIGHPNLSVQYDLYHSQRTAGNLTATIQDRIDRIGHVQIADSPARNQPGTGEINYPFVLAVLDAAGYAGWVSLEYKPLGSTEESLAWLREWGYWT